MKRRSKAKIDRANKAKAQPASRPNQRTAPQTRKLLGKHYANKYKTGRS